MAVRIEDAVGDPGLAPGATPLVTGDMAGAAETFPQPERGERHADRAAERFAAPRLPRRGTLEHDRGNAQIGEPRRRRRAGGPKTEYADIVAFAHNSLRSRRTDGKRADRRYSPEQMQGQNPGDNNTSGSIDKADIRMTTMRQLQL